ncbi:hypothetical protein SPRG_15781 [Saprolegnia parasitica CBS 223.65]|uniref:Uncharacterized protein n=1 Tax=Saprolegnia parasitica (strain CBS 223.65) TaxID=695850 RepID=A0A067BQD1_SAPPC|nr:hypothetical protein SPRG_15781 [Saprolegnia parasitica CBS 223.65]KDO18990.1 hypothetical protein SPRG_15781 [Saprolegnia parasitica CBS 223.65]|eukprot:XP_012210307.1 hypothetical protein SPRG_15781 [Saprolegnia parasitica CBS 223.65]
MSFSTCFNTQLPGLPGLVFYTNRTMEMLCVAMTAPNASAIDWAAQGSCFQATLCTLSTGHVCFWLLPGNVVHRESTDATAMTLTYVYYESRFGPWIWFKFGYRIASTLFVWYRLWHGYYKHVWALKRVLQGRGHRATLPSGVWSYEFVVGDPTAIILMDPSVATLYFLDIWLSVTNLAVAIMQVAQSGSLEHVFRSTWYLSRTVWFAYWSLCLVSYGLKRFHKEHVFADVDPTVLAIAVMVYGPLLTWMNGHIPVFTWLYQWTFTVGVPTASANHVIESCLGCIVYVQLIASIPLLYGLTTPYFDTAKRAKKKKTEIDYASFYYNNIKNRVALGTLRRRPPRQTARGGTVHAIMEAFPQLKATPTINLRATDCFVLCYCDGQLYERLRVSLLQCLDRRNADKVIAHSAEPSEFVVNLLRPAPLFALRDKGAGSAPPNKPYAMHRAASPSVWCI